MGAGIIGMSIAWVCRQRGAQVSIIDPAGVGAGASGGVVGALAPHAPERWETKKEFQLKSLLATGPFWQNVDTCSGLDSGYGQCGRLQPILNERGLAFAQERETAAKELWKGQANWQIRPASEFPMWAIDSPTKMVVHDTLSARIDPRRACESLARALDKSGVHITNVGVASDKVVWATGYRGLLDLSKEFGVEVGNGAKGQAALLDYDTGDAPQLFVDGIHFIPHNNATLGIGSTTERYFDDAKSTDKHLDDLVERARRIFPKIQNAKVLSRWANARPRSSTRAPILGEYPGKPGHFIANGGFKIGFGMAVEIAEVMADLLLDNHDRIPTDFRIDAIL